MSSLLVIGGTGFFGKSILDIFQRGNLDKYGINKIIITARRVDEFKLKYPELMFRQCLNQLKGAINKC